MTVHAYSRVSTGTQGHSLKVQFNTLHAYATTLQKEVEHFWQDEDVSGSVPLHLRPKGGQMYSQLSSGDIILVSKFDRLFRNSEDAIVTINWFKESGITLFIMDMGGEVTGDGVGKLIYTVLAGVADFERTRIAERIRDVKHLQKTQGKYLGGEVPWGHTKLVTDEATFITPCEWYQEALLFIAVERWERKRSYRKIASKVSKIHALVSPKTVSRILIQLEKLL